MEVNLTAFKRHRYRMKRLNPYFRSMSQDNLGVLCDDNVKDALKAQGFKIEEAPRSVYKVEKLYEALSKYAPGRVPSPPNSRELRSGILLARACFAKPVTEDFLKVLPLTAETIALITSKPSASAGLTAWGCNKAQAQTRALERGIQTLQGSKQPEPCLAFKRTQFNDKTRLVWGYPYSMTAIEGLLAYPLLQRFKVGNTPMAFAMKTGDLGTKLRVSSYHKEWAYSIDMSSFDASISARLIHEAFNILRTWFPVNNHDYALEPTTFMWSSQIFDLVENYFIHTPIVMPDGNLYLGKRHGVPSGSYFTQVVDSICNVIIAGAIAARFNLNLDKKDIFVLGDDLLIWSNRDISLNALANYASQAFPGASFNPRKSQKFHYDEPVHYLGRDWFHGIPDLPLMDILQRMVFPERYRKYPKDPEHKRKALRLLFLSYASVYSSAQAINRKVFGTDLWYKQGFAPLEVSGYLGDDGYVMQVPDYAMTGLQRYLHNYVITERSKECPTMAIQSWL